MGEVTKIYLVENCYGDPNKVYIGKTVGSRKSKHKETFGRDIIYTYIDEIKSIDKKEWKSSETFYIRYFKYLGFDVQNKNEGGAGPTFCSEKTKQLKSLIAKGKPKPKGFGEKCIQSKKLNLKLGDSYKRKVIDINNNIIYNSCTEAAKANNVSAAIISNSLSGLYKKSKWNFKYYVGN